MESSKKYLKGIISLITEKICREVYDATYLTSENRFKEMFSVQENRQKWGFTSHLELESIKNPESRYDLEYLLRREIYYRQGENSPIDEETHYWYYSPILEEKILDLIYSSQTEWDSGDYISQEIRNYTWNNGKIVDIGCGNGTLLKKLVELEIPKKNLLGIDISKKAIKRVSELGIKALKGPIQNLHWKENSISRRYVMCQRRAKEVKNVFKKGYCWAKTCL